MVDRVNAEAHVTRAQRSCYRNRFEASRGDPLRRMTPGCPTHATPLWFLHRSWSENFITVIREGCFEKPGIVGSPGGVPKLPRFGKQTTPHRQRGRELIPNEREALAFRN